MSKELSARRALVRGPGPAGGADPAVEAEARLRAAVEEVTALDLEVEALSAELADFARRYERAVGDLHAELTGAERVVSRLRRLEEALQALARRIQAGEPAPRPARGARRGPAAAAARRGKPGAPQGAGGKPAGFGAGAPRGAGGWRRGAGPARPAAPAAEPAGEVPAVEPLEVRAKRVYRRLARLLHPDLAGDDAERARLGELMAKVNAAWARRDLTALEVMAERLGAGESPGDVSPEARLQHLERRIAAMARFAASLARERDRLRRSDTFRLREEARRRAEAGGDLFAATREELEEEIAAAWADALARLGRLDKAAREVARARTAAMADITRRGPTGARRAFDPLREDELVRAGAARLERRRATAAARELARRLEDRAAAAPWEAALALLAFFAEEAGGRPPEALATAAAWAATWERLRAAWPGAPDLARALGRLPQGLEVGARVQGDGVLAGVQLADAELGAGVRIALEGEAVAAIARDVLAALGPEQACPACRARGPALHLYRTRGLDERHGLACAACGHVLRSYWRYGEVDGQEALFPHALRLGLVAEVTAELAGTSIGFGMTPAEEEALTAAELRRRFAELYLGPYELGLAPADVAISGEDGPLGPGTRLAGRDDSPGRIDRLARVRGAPRAPARSDRAALSTLKGARRTAGRAGAVARPRLHRSS
ncbi:MAG: J domain-containing protein [Anaeromyxobacteraceae bacterium]